MLEAGRIDGVSEIGMFHRLALPQLTPAVVTILLLQFVAIWRSRGLLRGRDSAAPRAYASADRCDSVSGPCRGSQLPIGTM